LLLLERVCGDAVEEREEVVPILHRDDPALVPKRSAICRPRRWAGSAKREAKRKTTCVFVTWAGALPGFGEAEQGTVNEHAASRRSARGAGAELGFSASSVSSAGQGARHELAAASAVPWGHNRSAALRSRSDSFPGGRGVLCAGLGDERWHYQRRSQRA